MRKVLFVLTLLYGVFGFCTSYAKTVQLGLYTTFDGEKYNKKKGPWGEGTMRMTPGTTYVAQGKKYLTLCDKLQGSFDGFHVTQATLNFNSGWRFEGTVDFVIANQTDKDRIIYTLKDGVLSFVKDARTKAKETIYIQNEDSLVISREMDDKSISVVTTSFYMNSLVVNSDKIHGYSVQKIFGNGCQKRQSHFVKSKRSFPSIVRYNYRIIEEWKPSTQNEAYYYDNTGRHIEVFSNNGFTTITRGEKEYVQFNSKRINKAYLEYNDAVFMFKDSVAQIKYSDNSIFDGHVYSNCINNDGDYSNAVKMLSSFFNNTLFSNTDITPFTGKYISEKDTRPIEWKYGHKVDDVIADKFVGTWSLYYGPYGSFNNLKEEGTMTISKDGSFKWFRKNIEYGKTTQYKRVIRDGKWDVNNNYLILNNNPSTTQYIQRVYPSTSGIKMTNAEVTAMDNAAKTEATKQQEKYRNGETEQTSNFDIVSMDGNTIRAFIGNYSYEFRKTTASNLSITSSNFIGRWACNDAVFDFKSDGTYTQYIREYISKWEWTEVYTISISGKWEYDGEYLIAYSNPTLCTVQIKMQSINTQVARSRVTAQQNYLAKEASTAQADHRKNDNPKTSFAKIIKWNGDSFILSDLNSNDYTFIKMK